MLLGPLPAQWLFALCAALEKPAHSDVVAALRSLMRKVGCMPCSQRLMLLRAVWVEVEAGENFYRLSDEARVS